MKATLPLLLASLMLVPAALDAQTGNVGIGTTNPQSKLHTTGSVRHDTMAGAGTHIVYADSAGRMFTHAITPTNQGNFFIPDNLCSSGIGTTSTITVAGQSTAMPSANIKVRINLSHQSDGEVRLFLLSPVGDTLRLVTNVGGTGDNFTNTISAATRKPAGIHFLRAFSMEDC